MALGPKPRSYRQHTPKKMIRLALLSALSDRAAIKRVALVDTWGWDHPSTKDAAAALGTLKLKGRVLVVLAEEETAARRSFANLPQVHTASFGELSAHDVLRCDWILFSDRTLPGSAEVFSTGLAEVAHAAPAASDDGPDAETPASETDVTEADVTEEATSDA